MKNKKRMIPVRMTPDPDLNRAAMPPEIFETIERFKSAGIDVRLSGYSVEQGSEWATKAMDAQRAYDATAGKEEN